jgi:hypothetical protein
VRGEEGGQAEHGQQVQQGRGEGGGENFQLPG